MEETILISKCCKQDALEDTKINERDHHEQIDIYTCSKCKQECEVEEVCAYCRGSGEVSTDERDSDGNWQSGVGSEKCICQIHEPDDFSGSSNEDR